MLLSQIIFNWFTVHQIERRIVFRIRFLCLLICLFNFLFEWFWDNLRGRNLFEF